CRVPSPAANCHEELAELAQEVGARIDPERRAHDRSQLSDKRLPPGGHVWRDPHLGLPFPCGQAERDAGGQCRPVELDEPRVSAECCHVIDRSSWATLPCQSLAGSEAEG